MSCFIKRFVDWFGLKPEIDNISKYPKFEEGQVWWCHIGENVGHEENGKGDKFLRPVVVVRKFNSRIFYGLPTSSVMKSNKYYFPITIKDKQVSVLMSQMKLIDVKRLSYKQGRISENELLSIKKKLSKIILGKN